MSLSELSRLPVSNLRLSAHISAPWTRKMSKRQQSVSRKKRSGQTEALRRFNSTQSAHTGWEVKETRAWLCVRGLHRPACCQPPNCENRTAVCVAESAAARAFAKSAYLLLLLSATCLRHGEHGVSLHNLISGLFLQATPCPVRVQPS